MAFVALAMVGRVVKVVRVLERVLVRECERWCLAMMVGRELGGESERRD